MNPDSQINDFVLKFEEYIDASTKFHDVYRKHLEDSIKLSVVSYKLREDLKELQAESKQLKEDFKKLKKKFLPEKPNNEISTGPLLDFLSAEPKIVDTFPQRIIETFENGDDQDFFDEPVYDCPKVFPKPVDMISVKDQKNYKQDLLSEPEVSNNETLDEILVFPHTKFSLNTYIEAVLTYVFSTRNFYVIIDLEKYKSMSLEMTNYYNKIKHFKAAPNGFGNNIKNLRGIYVLKTEPVYLRVQVLDCSDPENVFLMCVDSGEIKEAKIEDLIELDSHYSTNIYPIMAINCCLKGKCVVYSYIFETLLNRFCLIFLGDWQFENTLYEALLYNLVNDKHAKIQVNFKEYLPQFNRYMVKVLISSELTNNDFKFFWELSLNSTDVSRYNLCHVKKDVFNYKKMHPQFVKGMFYFLKQFLIQFFILNFSLPKWF